MAQLAQAYIHFKPYSASEREIRALGRYAEKLAVRTAKEIYGGGVVVEVELEEGSLRTRITVIGGIFIAVYSGVANYKGFKESVVELCEDARDFSVDVCAPFTKKAGVPKEDIYRFERRLKTPGKLYRISRRLEKLERSATDLSPKDVQKELARLRGELDSATHDLSQEEIKAIERGLRSDRLPSPRRWPAPPEHKVALRRDDDLDLPFGLEEAADADEPRRRLVFRSKTEVPVQRKRKKRHSQSREINTLVPPVDEKNV